MFEANKIPCRHVLVLKYGCVTELQITASCIDGRKAHLVRLYLMWIALKWMESQMRYQALRSLKYGIVLQSYNVLTQSPTVK